MKDLSIGYSRNSPQRTPLEPYCPKCHDSNYLAPLSCHTSELLEPFKISMLTSPVMGFRTRYDFKALSDCSSPYPEILDKITLYGRKERNLGGKSTNMDAFLDAMLRKREGCASGDEELGEYKHNFTKQLHRVKYCWRGTSLNYPFTYMRLRNDAESIICEEDYSNKKVNPNDGLFN